jgi:hypothetical protein
MKRPKWAKLKVARYIARASWSARLNGWTIEVDHLDVGYRVGLHRFNGAGALMPTIAERVPTLEEAQRAGEDAARALRVS